MKRLIILLSVLFLGTSIAQTESLRGRLFNAKQGLSQVTIYSIAQDSLGFIWVSTQNGVDKFDGYRFTVYKHIPGDSTSLPTNLTGHLTVGANNNLWLTIGSLFVLYDYTKDNFKTIKYPIKQINEIGKIVEDKNGTLWTITNYGLLSYKTGTGKFKAYIDTSSKKNFGKNNDIDMICYDGNDFVYFGDSNRNLKKININTGRMSVIKVFSPAEVSNFADLVCGDKNHLWVTTFSSGIFRINVKDGSLKHYNKSNGKLINNTVNVIYKDDMGDIYAGIKNYFCRYNKNTDRFDIISIETSGKKIGTDFNVSAILKDREGNFWIGLDPVGLVEVSPLNNKFHHLTKNSGKNESLPAKVATSILQDKKGNLWFGTYGGGMAELRAGSDKIRVFKHQSGNSNSIGSDNILSLCEDSAGNIWSGSMYNGLNKYIPSRNIFIRFPATHSGNAGYPQRFITSAITAGDGSLWFGTIYSSVYSYDPNSQKFFHYNPPPELGIPNDNLVAYTLVGDDDGNIWVGSHNAGILKFYPKDNKFINFSNAGDSSRPLIRGSIKTVYKGSDGRLWVASTSNLFYFDYSNKRFVKYKPAEKIAKASIAAILNDKSGNLWFSTDNGLFKLNMKTKAVEKYTQNDGLTSSEFVTNGACRTKNGEMYFATVNGITYFNPEEIKKNHTSPVVLTGFSVLNKKVKVSPGSPLKKNINLARQIDLSYKDYFFQFEFAALNYNNNKDLVYAYKMNGFDKEWVTTDSKKRFATYTNLSPGSYRFEVTTLKNGRPDIGNAASVAVYISPPFWNTWWFYILSLLTIAYILYSIYRYRLNKALELERLRVRIASDLHDDIGATLTKLALKADLLKHDVQDTGMRADFGRISEMSRQAVGSMRDIVWSIDSRNDNFESLLNKMKDFAFNIMADRDIKVDFKTEGFQSSQSLPIILRQNIYLIFKEAVNNIAKYADTDKIDIELMFDGKSYRMIIRDFGRSFEEKKFNAGHGLKNMRLRAERINAEINFIKDDGFTVELIGKLN